MPQAEARTLEELETERSEAAAVLERRMAAMEAALAARRSPREVIATCKVTCMSPTRLS